ncbi:unnamed protein product, partial [Discosporangium mesarthrocarpum]
MTPLLLQVSCPPGQFCIGGVASPCPAGRYGGYWQSSNSSCSGPCNEGYYCPEGSNR